ncbi:GTPase-activating protein and VPS9 domain-containing protein 1 [Aphelenchoides besseyi]|nr:GTPase-activating protein and VPS9 domain-containing protein 1 [Aphelenchoides besseyi]
MDVMVNSNSSDNVLGLCERLRSERLLVSSELETLQHLNRTIESDLKKLSEKIWICRQEQFVLQRLINCDPNVQPDRCCRLLSSLSSARFVPAHRVLGHHVSSVAELFRLLIQSPKAVAEFLNAADHINAKELFTFSFDDLCRSVFNFLYGSSIFPLDERKVLELLAHLISLQLVTKAEPRRVLRKGTSAFSKLYGMFSEELFSAKIFLTAALHEPIMFLLSQDEGFLDIDASKLPLRFHPEDRRKRFGADEESRQYKERVAAYRRSVLDRLALITMQFVKSIHQAISCFPSSLTWLVCQLKTGLLDKKRVSIEEADVICTDLIFTNFICQAITNPEPHGIISDTPISHVARFNLIQIGQILQTLALMPYEDPPAVMQELLGRITENTMPDVVHTVLSSSILTIEGMFPGVVVDGNEREMYARSACFGTLNEIQTMLEYLRTNAVESINDEALRRALKTHVRRLPEEFNANVPNAQPEDTTSGTPKSMLRSSSGRLRTFVDRVQHVAKSGQQRLLTNLPNSPSFETDRNDNPSPVSQQRITSPIEVPEVLVLTIVDDNVPLGLESEDKIMSAVKPSQQRKHTTSDSLAEKKTRFKPTESIVSDLTATTDAASDDEDDGEAAASICSSDPAINDMMADEVDDPEEDVSTLPDNFSDVVPISANVSGRGSPSLSGGRGSGRGTPFSGGGGPTDPTVSVSSTVAEAAGASRNEAHRNLPKLPVTIKKQNPEGLEEKFGKFGLPPQDPTRYRDETYSLVSDSWSTDVVASDNEGLNEIPPIPPPIPPRQQDQSLSLPVMPAPSGLFLPPTLPVQNQPPIHESLSAGRINEMTANNATGGLLSTAERERIADDILNKYRTAPATPASSNGANPTVPLSNGLLLPNASKSDDFVYYDPANITQCKAFIDAKRKLRLVLSSAANIPTNMTASRPTASSSNVLLSGISNSQSITRAEDDPRANLNEFLKLLLAESINSQDKTLSAQIREAQRSLSIFDQRGIRKLLRTLKDEHRRRTSYLMYLQQSRLTLLQLSSYFSKLSARVSREKSLIGECLIEMLVRLSVENNEQFLRKFIYEFRRSRAQDERTYIVDRALNDLYAQIDIDSIWQGLSDENIEYVRKSMERAIMTQIYQYALYPNQDADQYRDDVFFKALRSIASFVGPDHPELRIPKRFHGECPWPSAQAEIAIINAYKAPRDKMACVMRCCETIENLIGLASDRAASADDITPVLVYVLLQVVVLSELSIYDRLGKSSCIAYIEGFYARRMPGEEAYWWTQFRAAVEFLKSLCHKHHAAPPSI